MEFKDLRDAKTLMSNLAHLVGKTNRYYDEFVWFSSINYTTISEYQGELKFFLNEMIVQNDIPAMNEEVTSLYEWLNG